MKLLVKGRGLEGLAAHIADAFGQPLCTARLDPAKWQTQDRSTYEGVICRTCRRSYERQTSKLDSGG